MKRSILLLLFFIFFGSNIQAQKDNEYAPKISANTLQYLTTIKSQTNPPSDPKFVYSNIDNRVYINAFAEVNNKIQPDELTDMGILIGTKAGNIWTLKIPSDKVEAFAQLEKGINRIQLDQPIYSNMEKAREKTRVDLVHKGTGLPQAYSGKDVVVGILDVGFDYTHPTFYDTTGNMYRIKRVWEQKTTGTPPSSYSYGHEIIDSMEMMAQQSDNVGQSHGSHVAGIAAGSGFGGDADEYRGVAYESELVFVGITPDQDQWTNTGMTDIVDGLNYIFDYAESQGKPAVANLSWGCTIGPHDGTSLFSQAVNNLTGEGKIFTISAGNNGENKIHLNKQFSITDTMLQSFVAFSNGLSERKTWIDIWGEEGESFCIKFGVYTGTFLQASTDYMCLNSGIIDTFLIGSDNDTLFINMTTLLKDINDKPHAFLDLHTKTNNHVSISVQGTSGEVNVWMGYVLNSTGYYGEFYKNNVVTAVSGDADMTIGEMGCTSSAITVGAFASKTDYINLAGQTINYNTYVLGNRICPFSSKGPTTDGRMKPDITAPGMTLASAVNSFDANYSQGGGASNSIVHEYTDVTTARKYYYGESSGTSMSSPMTAGIVALLLEAKPNLSPDEIKDIIADTAIKDVFTTDTPNSDIWGLGKIDAYAMMQYFFPSALAESDLQSHHIYPNPTSNILNLDWDGTKSITVTNMNGEICLKLTTSDKNISLKNLNSGIYIVTIFSTNDSSLTRQKVIKI